MVQCSPDDLANPSGSYIRRSDCVPSLWSDLLSRGAVLRVMDPASNSHFNGTCKDIRPWLSPPLFSLVLVHATDALKDGPPIGYL
jgi:hypothetical protein